MQIYLGYTFLMSPLISVIIPTYNRQTIVLETIRSAINQEPENFEIIVVDDGSTDKTIDYLEYLNLPIRLIRTENKGVSNARNTGIKASNGEYCAFLDSDDIWLDGILKNQSNYLDTFPNIPLVYTDHFEEVFNDQGSLLKQKSHFQSYNFSHQEKSKYSLPFLVQPSPILTSSVMIKKKVFEQVGLFDENLKVAEDLDLFHRISSKYQLGYINKPLAIYSWCKDPNHLLSLPREVFFAELKKYLDKYSNQFANGSHIKQLAIKESYRRLSEMVKIRYNLDNGLTTIDEYYLQSRNLLKPKLSLKWSINSLHL